jgi:hypothetical protein
MQPNPLLIGVTTILLTLAIVLALAIGFGVEMAQALSQALPIVLIAGGFTALATKISRSEQEPA